MDKDEFSTGVVEEVHIHWYACEGTELTEDEAGDIEELFDSILNDEIYFEETDAWVMELMLFEVLCPEELKYIFGK